MKKYIRIWVTLKRMTYKIRSASGPLIGDYEKWLGNRGLAENWNDFW
jgi:hypothetical protein